MRTLAPRWRSDSAAAELLEDGAVEVEHVDLVLGEGGDLHVVSECRGALPRFQLAQQQVQQGRLARAVGSDHADLPAALDDQVDVGQHVRVVVVAHATPSYSTTTRPARGGAGNPNFAITWRCSGTSTRSIFSMRLDARLDRLRLGRLGAEAGDELLLGRDLAVLGGACPAQVLHALLALGDELVVGAQRTARLRDVLGGGAGGQLDHALGHAVDEVAVVGHEQDRALVGGQRVLEPGDRVEVEVVGGLVEHQHVGTRQQQPGQRHAHAPATGHLGHQPVGVLGREPEAVQHAMGVGLQGVAAEVREPLLQVPVLVQGGRVVGESRLELVHAVRDGLDLVRRRPASPPARCRSPSRSGPAAGSPTARPWRG